MTTAAKRARKKENQRTGSASLRLKTERANAHEARIAAAAGRKAAETAEVDDFFGAPIIKKQSSEEAV